MADNRSDYGECPLPALLRPSNKISFRPFVAICGGVILPNYQSVLTRLRLRLGQRSRRKAYSHVIKTSLVTRPLQQYAKLSLVV